MDLNEMSTSSKGEIYGDRMNLISKYANISLYRNSEIMYSLISYMILSNFATLFFPLVPH